MIFAMKLLGLVVLIPIGLSAFTHLWNPIQFPNIHPDEGTYMLHSMRFLIDKVLLPEGAAFYDHPYFGQIFLGAVLGLTGYPDSLQPTLAGGTHSIENLHLFPRLVMGILSVFDTFLVYKISKKRYNLTVALIASILFAVMPITWILRRIFLDPILLPFLLSSVLLAMYSKETNNSKKNTSLIFISGILLGLSIFTKIPAFAMIPFIGYIILSRNNKNFKLLGLWFIPVILIPAIWPALAFSIGQLDFWFDAVIRQASGREDKPLLNAIIVFYQIDPTLLIIGIAGLIYSAIKRDVFVLLFVVPYLVFLQLVGFVSVYHLTMIIPVFCIAAAILVHKLSLLIKVYQIQKVIPYAVVLAVGSFGFFNNFMLITNEFNSSYYKLYVSLIEYLSTYDNKFEDKTDENMPLVIGRYWTKSFIWGIQYGFDKDYIFVRDDLRCCTPSEQSRAALERVNSGIQNNNLSSLIDLQNIVVIVDNRMKRDIEDTELSENYAKISTLYNNTHIYKIVDEERSSFNRGLYPYSGLYDNRGIGRVEIRVNK